MESGIDGHLVTRFSLSRPRFHRGTISVVQDRMETNRSTWRLDYRQKLHTRGCAGELRCRGRGRIHEEYGEFL